MLSLAEAEYGEFSGLSKSYDKGRRDFPVDTLNFILRATSVDRPDVLDLGCGTGIATRTLAARQARVVGCDMSLAMLERALRHQVRNASYCYGYAEDIPFPDADFDVVTCFSAFHWFATEEALREIWRVLRIGGVLAIVNKNEMSGGIKDRWRSALRDIIGDSPPDVKRNYDPLGTLQRFGFAHLQRDSIPVIERFTIEEALTYLQSTSIWNLIPPHHRQDGLRRLHEFCLKEVRNNIIERQLDVETVIGLKMIH